MNLDFTLKRYEELCKFLLDIEIKTSKVKEYLTSKVYNRNIIIRHDVDRLPQSALRMAMIEKKYGIESSYYFRMEKRVFIPSVIEAIAKLGHEIGYHYEVVDKARGDLEKGIEIFAEELAKFKKICDVKTIAMHGNPLSKWDNKVIWSKYNFKDYGIIGEVYLSIDYNKVIYFSDTGRTWLSNKHKLKDYVSTPFTQLYVSSTDELMDFLKKCTQDVCLLVHPNRWAANWYEYIYQWMFDTIGNIIKGFLGK